MHTQMLQEAKKWTMEAGSLIRRQLKHGDFLVETKSSVTDLVTAVDRKVEQYFVDQIQTHYPNHQIIGEEGICKPADNLAGYVWIIDPIDGTTNFVSQQRDFAISIALFHQQTGLFGIIYHVMEDHFLLAEAGKGLFLNGQKQTINFPPISLQDSLLSLHVHQKDQYLTLLSLASKVRGIRSYGAATVSLSRVALNQIQGYLIPTVSPWDYAAGKIIVEEAGGIITNFQGGSLPLDQKSSLLACHPALHDELLTWMQDQKDKF